MQLIIDIFQHGHPTAVIGFCLLATVPVIGLACLAIGLWQDNQPAKRRRYR